VGLHRLGGTVSPVVTVVIAPGRDLTLDRLELIAIAIATAVGLAAV
jgi:hypothetical protein